jgi:hypothetical protein
MKSASESGKMRKAYVSTKKSRSKKSRLKGLKEGPTEHRKFGMKVKEKKFH